jgi:hypothetical protein
MRFRRGRSMAFSVTATKLTTAILAAVLDAMG